MKKVYLVLAILLLLSFTILYFSDILFSNQIFSFRDLSRYYYPTRLFAVSQIKAGHFPFWNPYVGSGHPLFAALQSCVLYPLSIAYYLFNFDFAFNLFIILHIFLGGLFFYILMLDLGYRQISSLIAALTFMFGGYLISVINLTTTLTAAVWFPLVFLFYNRALVKKSAIDLVLSCLFLGLMFLGGEPTPLYATVLLLGLYTILECFSAKKEIKRPLLIFTGFIIIFALLFSFQILPFWELMRLSDRGATDFNCITNWSFPPRDVVNFFMPYFYGPLSYHNESPMRQDWLLLSYLGVLPALLFIIALFFSKDKKTRFFKLIFLIGLIFIFGKFTPIYKLLYKFIPGFGLIRYPVKFFFLNAVAFSFLCASGWQEYCLRIERRDERFFRFIKCLLVICCFSAILFLALHTFKQEIGEYVSGYLKHHKPMDELWQSKAGTVFVTDFFNLRRGIVFFITASLLLFVGVKRKARLGLVGFAAVTLIFIDLYGGKSIDVNPAVSKEIMHKKTTNVLFLQKDKALFRIYTSNEMNKENDLLKGKSYEEAFAKSVDSLSNNRLIEFGIYDARGYFSIHNFRYSKILLAVDTVSQPSSNAILNMLNVKYILTPKEINDPACVLVNRGIESYLYENKNFLPRAYLVSAFVVLKDEAEIAKKLKSKDFNPRKEVILEEEPKISQAQPVSVKKGEKDLVRIINYQPNEVNIGVNISKEPKFLILADNYYPGWEVFVDNKKEKLYKANFILRAVYLSVGEHKVRFVYNPVSFKIGLLISISCAILIIFVLVILRRRACVLARR